MEKRVTASAAALAVVANVEGRGEEELYSNKSKNDDVDEMEAADEEDSCFASDFYGCGTDWSCLLTKKNDENRNDEEEEEEEVHSKKKAAKCLRQTNLLQMWGYQEMKIPPPHHKEESNPNGNDASSSLPIINMNGKPSTHDCRSATASNNNHRPRFCPFYKKIPGTPFTVDAFRYGRIEGCSAYFLTHFHADHYGGLSKGWSHGPIYCTSLTARLVRTCLSVNSIYIRPMEIGEEYVVEGIRLTMLEANHCPGAALIHFRLPDGQCCLHTGDFRAHKLMQDYPLLNQRVNVLYLDTTYCNPKYRFPSKEDVLSFVVRVSKNCLKMQPKTLIVVGAYSIGKEWVYLAVSKALGVKIYANASRRRILHSFHWPELSGNLCSHGKDTPLHVLPISSVKFETLEHYLKSYANQYKAVLAFRPTGWTYSETVGSNLDLIKPRCTGVVRIYGVPYSEHSSFTELQEFVQFLRPDKIVPTVNVYNAANRDKMQSYFREWMKG